MGKGPMGDRRGWQGAGSNAGVVKWDGGVAWVREGA